MPADAAVSWLERNDLTPDVTDPEWALITAELGDRRSFILHLDALGRAGLGTRDNQRARPAAGRRSS